jgi:phenylalanyl-tRNA synthetase beta chain
MRHEDGDIRLFELGRVYLARDNDLPDEPEVLCGILSGSGLEKTWHNQAQPFYFFDAKGLVEGLLAQLGVTASFGKSSDNGLQPGKQAAVAIDSAKLGVVGQLHPVVASAFEIPGIVYLFEIYLAALLPHAVVHKAFKQLERFPAVVRDMALVVDAGVSHQQVLDVIGGFSLVNKVTLFDVYTGKQVPPGKKSLAYRLTYRSADHTLTDKEADRVQRQILKRLASQLGASLRA